MSTHRSRRLVAFLALASAVVIACGSAYGTDPSSPGDLADAAPEGAVAEDAASLGDAGRCTDAHPSAVPSDLEGCGCTSEPPRVCAIGVTGGASKCQAGTQACEAKRWTACTGATAPSSVETCYDQVDDDCDGVLNNGCRCTAGFNLCETPDGGALASVVVRLVPSTVKMGDSLDLFIAYHGVINSFSASVNGSYCLGTGGVSCVAGTGCAGWMGWRWHMSVIAPAFKVGLNNVKVLINEPAPGPCNNGTTIVGQGSLTVTP